MITTDQIRIIDIESINNCNARCPLCLREQLAKKTNDRLDWEALKQNVPSQVWQTVTQINFNGTTGDNVLHPDIMEILIWCVENTTAMVSLHTNGSVRSPEWWHKLGQRLKNTSHRVVFGIDGLADTHSRYRIATNWNRIIENSSSFIKAGGRAEWQMILFDHNHHQVYQCRKMSEELGFKRFFTIFQDRFHDGHDIDVKKLDIDKTDVPITFVKTTSKDLKSSQNKTGEIKCQSQQLGWISIYADGTVWPCCWLMGWHLVNHTKAGLTINYHFKKVLKIDFDQISIYNNNLQDIITSDLWQQRYPNSFSTMPNAVCVQQCRH